MTTIRKLTAEDIPACRTLWQARFGDSDAFCDWYFSERFCPDLSLGLFENDMLCSMAHGRRMSVHYGAEVLPVLMIGGVSTKTAREGRGLMKRVMAKMDGIGHAIGAKLLILATETPPLYQSSGFQVCAKALYAKATGETVQPLNLDTASYDIDALIECAEAACGGDCFFPARTAADMESRIRELCCEGAGLLTLKNTDNTLEGYAFYDPNSGRADEVIAGSPDGYRTLLAMLPRGTTAMLPPYLPFDGERERGAWLMCKPLQTVFPAETGGRAFCPETF